MKMGGCLRNILKTLSFEKKCGQKWDKNFEKLILCKNFYNKLCFLLSNLILECFQLSFDIHFVYVGQKWQIFKNRSTEIWKFSAVKVGYFDDHLTAKLCNLGWCSKTLHVDKDASFHLRPFMNDLAWHYTCRSAKRPLTLSWCQAPFLIDKCL